MFFIWVLARQRGLSARFFVGYPLIAGACEALLLLMTTLAAEALLLLIGRMPILKDWQGVADILAQLVLFAGIAIAIARLVEGFVFKVKGARQGWRFSNIARTAFYGGFLAIGLVMFLVSKGYTPAEFYVWTGATAAILAFIMQQTLGDLFSGLALSIERPFKIGDWIRMNDGTEGQVEDINWRATHLRGWDRSSFVIPNGILARMSFTNLHDDDHVFAPWYTVKVSGDHAPEHVISLLQAAVESCATPLKAPPPLVRLMDGNQSPYTYMVWVHFANYPTMFMGREEIYRAVDGHLRAAGLEIAAPIQDVRYRKMDGPAAPLS